MSQSPPSLYPSSAIPTSSSPSPPPSSPLSYTSPGSHHTHNVLSPLFLSLPTSHPRPEGLHLNEVTWDNINQFQAPPDQRYEIINGYCIIMTTERRRRNEAISRLGHLIMLRLGIDVGFVPSHQVRFNVYEDWRRSKPCVRVPDLAFQFKTGNETILAPLYPIQHAPPPRLNLCLPIQPTRRHQTRPHHRWVL